MFIKVFEDCIFFNVWIIFIEKYYLECVLNGLSDLDNIIVFCLLSFFILMYDNYKLLKNVNYYCLFCLYVI